MRLTRTATLAVALMIVPVAFLRPDGDAEVATPALDAPAPAEATELVERWLAALNQGAVDGLEQFVADDLRLNGERVGIEGLRTAIAAWRAASPARQARAFPLVAEGRLVGLWSWTDGAAPDSLPSAPPRADRVQWIGADFLRVEDGRIVEGWLASGRLGLSPPQRG